MIKIIKARKSHIPEIVELWKEFMDFHKDINPYFTRSARGHKKFEEFISRSIGSRKQQLFIALDNKQVVGYAFVLIIKYPPILKNISYGLISDMAVNKKYRKQGIGLMLFDEVREWFLKKGVKRIELSVASKNISGYSFWKKTGFKEYTKKIYLEI